MGKISNACRIGALFAMAVLTIASAPSSIPASLLGSWSPVEIHQSESTLYEPGRGPVQVLAAQILTIHLNDVTFFQDRCQSPIVIPKHGEIGGPIKIVTGESLAGLGLPAEDKAVDYFELRCAHSLVDLGDGTGFTHDRGLSLSWFIIPRSEVEIDLPFYQSSYIRFRRTRPNS